MSRYKKHSDTVFLFFCAGISTAGMAVVLLLISAIYQWWMW
jgi:hypothetical protein